MERCIWIVEQEGEFFLAEGASTEPAILRDGFRDVRAAKATAETRALQANASAIHGTVRPPIAVREYARGPLFRPDRVLADGWSWIEEEN